MKILFICGSLESGKDGVGDYTRRLAGEFIRQGHPSKILALNDKHVSTVDSCIQKDFDEQIQVLRLPFTLSWKDRIATSERFVNDFNPQWISLQYVPFSFNDRGMPLSLSGNLQKIGKERNWHVMFHEVWIGHSSTIWQKDYWIGRIQRFCINSLFRKIRVLKVTTQSEYYKFLLNRNHIETTRLPLFGNIQMEKSPGICSIAKAGKIDFTKIRNGKKLYHIAVIFGSVYPGWNILSFLKKWDINLGRTSRIGVVFLMGNHGCPVDELIHNWSVGLLNIQFFSLGVLPANEISKILQLADFGINPTPLAIIQKSGTAAAMNEHGLSVVTTRIGNVQKQFRIPDLRPLICYSENMNEDDIENLGRRPAFQILPEVVREMLDLFILN